MIPRPYKDFKPNCIVHDILNHENFPEFVKVCATETMKFLRHSLLYCSKADTKNTSKFITMGREPYHIKF